MALPPAQPSYILRGHASQIHSTSFVRLNSKQRLLTGDADGWLVIWNLDIKRPLAVWRAHEGAMLGADTWGDERLITHGKDNKLVVWRLTLEDEQSLSTLLPVDTPSEPRRQPWILHILHVNTMNFCSFAWTWAQASERSNLDREDELLVAVPNTLSSESVDIFHLPSEKRIHTVPSVTGFKGGMVMALSLFHHPETKVLTVIAGYESGHTSISQLVTTSTPIISASSQNHKFPKGWGTAAAASSTTTSQSQGTSSQIWQPLYLTQPHTQPILSLACSPCNTYYLTSSADSVLAKHPIPSTSNKPLACTPLKTNTTKHAGQQSLRIRNDGKIFATAGWDARIRVYGCKSLKELAVLKWHTEGCFAVAFAKVESDGDGEKETSEKQSGGLVKRATGLSVKEERMRKAEKTHWIAAGSKDGKVSLWDIY